METVKISFDIETSDAECPLGVQIWLDGAVLLTNNHVQEKISFAHDIVDDDSEHKLQVIIWGKTADHTKVDEAGNITKDALISISKIQVDEIDIVQIFHARAQYHHDFNGSQAPVTDKFHRYMGCNGAVTFKFSTPIYLWLLENM